MRRIAALLALFVLSLSRFGAAATPAGAHQWTIGRMGHELVSAAPAARLAPPALRSLVARTPDRAPAPWLPWLAEPPERGVEAAGGSSGAPRHTERPSAGRWRAFTYDATAPPRLS